MGAYVQIVYLPPNKITRKMESREKQLGMSYGKACHTLRKKVLFNLAKKLRLNICYRCSKAIRNVEEFSIDHKKPWLNENTKLFWSLGNIAFSHLSCNSSHSRRHKKYFTTEEKSIAQAKHQKAWRERNKPLYKRQRRDKYLRNGT